MVLARSPSSSSIALRHQLPQLMDTEEGKQYCYKPIPIKRRVLHSVKFNGYYNSDQFSYHYNEPSQLNDKRTTRDYRCIHKSRCVTRPTHIKMAEQKKTIPSRTAGSNRSERRRVHFKEETDIRELPERNSEDKYRCWYNKSDYVRFSSERKDEIHMIQQLLLQKSNKINTIHTYLDPNKHTLIGIEQYIYGKEHIMCRKLHALQHVRSILQQQQYNNSYNNSNNNKMQQQQQKPLDDYYIMYPEYYGTNTSTSSVWNHFLPHCDESIRYVSQQQQHLPVTMQHAVPMVFTTVAMNPMQHA